VDGVTSMPGFSCSNSLICALNAAVAAAVLPGINDATLILTTGTLAEAVVIELVATATKVAAATTPPMRMDVLALDLNFITFSSPSLGTVLRH
jgi:hypothetical protein